MPAGLRSYGGTVRAAELDPGGSHAGMDDPYNSLALGATNCPSYSAAASYSRCSWEGSAMPCERVSRIIGDPGYLTPGSLGMAAPLPTLYKIILPSEVSFSQYIIRLKNHPFRDKIKYPKTFRKIPTAGMAIKEFRRSTYVNNFLPDQKMTTCREFS
jgi:hypothetical protein